MPADAWSQLFARAKKQIDVLAYSALFLSEDITASTVLRDKVKAGVRVRLALGRPSGAHIADRGGEEGIGDGMGARIRNALVSLTPLVAAGAELRFHDTVLDNSVYRADNEALINTHVYGHPASYAPVFHLRLQSDMGMTTTYFDSFEQVWAVSRSISETDRNWPSGPLVLGVRGALRRPPGAARPTHESLKDDSRLEVRLIRDRVEHLRTHVEHSSNAVHGRNDVVLGRFTRPCLAALAAEPRWAVGDVEHVDSHSAPPPSRPLPCRRHQCSPVAEGPAAQRADAYSRPFVDAVAATRTSLAGACRDRCGATSALLKD